MRDSGDEGLFLELTARPALRVRPLLVRLEGGGGLGASLVVVDDRGRSFRGSLACRVFRGCFGDRQFDPLVDVVHLSHPLGALVVERASRGRPRGVFLSAVGQPVRIDHLFAFPVRDQPVVLRAESD